MGLAMKARCGVWLAAAALASACGSVREDCERFVAVVNHGIERMRGPSRPDPKNIEAVVKERRELAKHYELLARDVAALKLSDRKLRMLAERYEKLTAEAALALGRSADSLEHREHAESHQREAHLDALSKDERELVKSVTARCAAE